MRARRNPFQGRREDLKGRQLSADQKLFIGSLAGRDGETCSSVGVFYNIASSTVGRYSVSYKGQVRPKKNGRPSKLDDLSTEVIQGLLLPVSFWGALFL